MIYDISEGLLDGWVAILRGGGFWKIEREDLLLMELGDR